MDKSGIKHVAIIPDGNRRWAINKGLAAVKGHEYASDKLESLVECAKKNGVEVFSLWVFSTENWKRPTMEVEQLLSLLEKQLNVYAKKVVENKVRVKWIGRRDRVPESTKVVIEELIEETKNNSDITLQICLDYGGRDEILRAVNKAVESGKQVTESQFNELLDTQNIPSPHLIIRTSGEKRLSGFMPWQGIYAELLFVDKFFPDFTAEDLESALTDFSSRTRRFGGD